MNIKISVIIIPFFLISSLSAQNELQLNPLIKIKSSLKSESETFNIEFDQSGNAYNSPNEVSIRQDIAQTKNNTVKYSYTITAKENTHFSFHQKWRLEKFYLDEVDFYMPGFWYKKNLRSPDNAPSIRMSESWNVRDDRLSSPLVAVYNKKTNNYYFIHRSDQLTQESLLPQTEGEVILPSISSIGSLGFYTGQESSLSLTAQYPFSETPYSYQSKLSLKPALESFIELQSGDSITFSWELVNGKANDFTDLVEQIWRHSFDYYKPKPLQRNLSDNEIKSILSNYFIESVASTNGVTGFSGLWFDIQSCETTGVLSVGFCGRTILNAFNLLEYATDTKNTELLNLANKVIDSYFNDGWTSEGQIRELIYEDYLEDIYSLRKQTEGIVALLYITKYKKERGEDVSGIEMKLEKLLDNFTKLQKSDGSLPRKFNLYFEPLDNSKGSTQLIITPMLMAYKHFGDSKYLEAAKKAAIFVEKNLIEKADYFSSTLDANCEDKEAALIASTSLYHLAILTENPLEKKRLMNLVEKAATFTLSWYYLYDVPFAKGQLLKGVNLKTRGWGSVSTENNHIDVYVFDFLEVLRWLGNEKSNYRFVQMADVIESSIRDQMLPYPYHMLSVGKEGYMPEIIQQTLWDYGANGKGFLNVHGSIGWTVASVWEMLTPGRFDWFIH